MTSIITSKFRMLSAQRFKDSFADDNFYLFIGRPQPWTPNDNIVPTPIDSDASFTELWRDIVAMKRINSSNVVKSIPRYTWAAGTTYDEYSHDYNESNKTYSDESNLYDSKFFVINSSYQVFKCLSNGNNSQSTVEPTNTTTIPNPPRLADGYIWKYMYTLDTNSVLEYASPDFIPVLVDSNVTAAAISGSISTIKVTNAGTNYTGTPTVTITGNGTGATATVVKSGNTIQYINIVDPGSGYDYATVTISGGSGSGASAKAIISPPGGHGSNAANELGAYNVTISVKLNYDESGDFVVNNDYRRIGILANPLKPDLSGPLDSQTANATNSMTLNISPTPGAFIVDDIITGDNTGATARIVSYNSDTRVIRYIKSSSENDTVFEADEAITNESAQTAVISSLAAAEVAMNTGTVIYVDNRKAISRASDQIEQIVITLEF